MQMKQAMEDVDKQTIYQSTADVTGANKAQKMQKRTKHKYK